MIDVAFLGSHVRPAGTAVIVDVLRATSTIALALASGYERVLVAGTIEQARELRAPERVLAGEVGCARAPGFDLGNSPEETLAPRGRELVLATTNGAPAIVGAAQIADRVLAAALLNLHAVVAQLADEDDVLLVCAGTDGRVSLEDVYLAGRLSAALAGERSDAAQVAQALAASYSSAREALEASAGAVGLRREGLQSDIAYCAQESIVDVVPRVESMDGAAAVLTAAGGARAAAGAASVDTQAKT